MATTAIGEVLQSIQSRPDATPGDVLISIRENIRRVDGLLRHLTGVEQNSRPALLEQKRLLEVRLGQICRMVRNHRWFHLLSMEPLKWRDKKGWPRLAVFALHSPRFELSVKLGTAFWSGDSRYRTSIFPKLPKPIAECYDDVLNNLEQSSSRSGGQTLKLRCEFNGLIPDEIKRKISEHRSFFRDIYLIAEPSNLRLEATAVVVPNQDPLVVGFDGHDLWLIADFETTPVEDEMFFYPPRPPR